MMRSLLAAMIRVNRVMSRCCDRLLPAGMRVDGNRAFIDSFAPGFLRPGLVVYDCGGGKNPLVGLDRKSALGLRSIGLDIDASELARAPAGAYDETICADIASYRGRGDADLVFCQALLEHVSDVSGAFAGLASIVKPGGVLLLFVPSRNALFARLNLALPERLKRAILFTIFPSTARNQGFPSYYDQCTPADFRRLAQVNGLEVVETRLYWISSYFSFFTPLYVMWRLQQMVARMMFRDQAAETFSMAMKRIGPLADVIDTPDVSSAPSAINKS